MAVTAAEVFLAIIAGNIRELCGESTEVADAVLHARDWEQMASSLQQDMKAVHTTDAIADTIDCDWCQKFWESSDKRWRHHASQRAEKWQQDARHYFRWTNRSTLVDLRDSRTKVLANPAVSAALPFNASVEVLTDGILASHKAHYA